MKERTTDEDMDLACLDHAYFREEIDKLTRIIFDVRRDRFEIKGAKGTDFEWHVLEQIEIQLDHLCSINDQLIMFDSKERLNEIYTMAETLFKIKTGKLEQSIEYLNDDASHDYYDYGDQDEEDHTYFDFCSVNIANESLNSKKKRSKTNKNKRNQKKKTVVV